MKANTILYEFINENIYVNKDNFINKNIYYLFIN